MMPLFEDALIFIEIVAFCVTAIKLWKLDAFATVIYALLFYFSLTLNVVYLHFPELLASNRYVVFDFWDYDAKFWLQCYLFTLLSLVSYYVFINLFIKKIPPRLKIDVSGSKVVGSSGAKYIALTGILLFTVIDVYFFLKNIGLISYQNTLSATFKANHASYNIMCTLILSSAYYVCAIIPLVLGGGMKKGVEKRLIEMCAGICLLVLVTYSYLAGDKSTLAIPLLGLGVPALYKYRKVIKLRHYLFVGTVFGALYLIITFQSQLSRGGGGLSGASWVDILFPSAFQQNVFNLFAVIRYDYIEPIEVVISTVTHFFLNVSHPYLFQTVGNLYATFSVSGTFSFGHFPFADGYAFAGNLGFLYNGIVIGYFVSVWRRLAKTQDETLNQMMLSLMCALALGLVRGSGMANFVKYLYLYALPMIVIYCIITGNRVNLYVRKKK